MEFWKICIAGLVGTTMMTLFSKVCGRLFSKEFSEPKFLDTLIRPSLAANSENNFLGWIAHYLIGILFAFLVYWNCANFGVNFAYLNGIFLGPLLGLFGILGWSAMLLFNKKPDAMEVPAFYIQLVFAHMVFVFVAMIVLRFFESYPEA